MSTKPSTRRAEYWPVCAALEVTLRCNMACVHCGSNATRRELPNKLRHREWLDVIDELKEIGTENLALSGGEPFLYPKWRQLIAHIRKRGMRTHIISNGSCVSEDDVRFLKSQGVDHIGVSLDGDEEVHDRIRRSPGSFRKIMELLAIGRANDFPINLITSVNRINFSVRRKVLEVVKRNQVRLWQVQVVNSFGRAGRQKDELILKPWQFVRLCDDILRWKRENRRTTRIEGADSLGYCHPVTDAILGDCEWRGCNAGLYNLGIRTDGTVLGCLSLQDEHFASGNIRNRRLSEIWRDDSCFPYTRAYDVASMEGGCGRCRTRSRCKAGCLSMVYSVAGTIFDNPYCYKKIVKGRRAPGPK